MAISRTQIAKLCTATEQTLAEGSFGRPGAGDTPARITGRIKRARALRDKYRSRAQSQRREQRGKVAPRGRRGAEGNDNTLKKAQIFDETQARYEMQLAQVERQQQAADHRAAKRSTKPTTRRRASTGATASASGKRRASKAAERSVRGQDSQVAMVNRMGKPQRMARKGHVQARTARRQAKRDSR